MLEALPMGFGLLPARVRETECVGNGADHCCYEVEFGVRTFKGLVTGALLGTLLASAAVAAFAVELIALPVALIGAALLVFAGGALGHNVDLARQLEVVAGARRGHLALLEQADRALAEKMDELARLNAHEDAGASANADRLRAILTEREASRGTDEAPGATAAQDTSPNDVDRDEIERASEQLYDALGPMQRSLERVHRLLRENRDAFDDGGDAVFDALRGVAEESRRIAATGASLAGAVRPDGKAHEPVDFVAVVSRAVDSVRPLLTSEQQIRVDIADAVPRVRCEPFLMEQVAYHLLRNAAQASDRDGEVELRLAVVPGGVELCVEDHGIGIPEEILDQVFDPFALEGKPAGEHGLGLAICYRIVTEHGGELRVSTDAGEGTRMTVALRCDDRSPEEPA
jgi:signal transduction histidine kinase